jgi:tetratricopeptide (TPR) repeat protein
MMTARVTAAEDPETLLDEVERLARMFLTGEATVALTRFDHREPHPEPARLARRQVCYGMVAIAEGNLDEAERALRSALAGYRDLSDREGELVVLSRLGALLASDEARFHEGLRLATESAEQLSTAPDPRVGAAAQLRLAVTLARGERYLDALAAVDRAATFAGRHSQDPLFQAEINSDRAHCLLMLARYGEAADAASAARAAYASIGTPPAAASVYLVSGHILLATGAITEAIAAFTSVIELAPGPDLVVGALVNRARARSADGQPGPAADDLAEAVELSLARDQKEQAAYLYHELAEALQWCGKISDAARAAEQAVVGLDAIGAQSPADLARHLLAGLYTQLREPDLAVSLLDQLVANLDGFDNAPRRGRLWEETAILLRRQDRHACAAARFARAAAQFHLAGLPLDEVRTLRKEALAWRWANDAPAAVAALARVDDIVSELPDEPAAVWETAMVAYDAAVVYAGFGMLTQALERATGMAERFRSVAAYGEAVNADLLSGELLLRCGRPDSAAGLLAPTLAGIPEDSPLVEPAVTLLATALEALGRGQEAESLRLRYGNGSSG